MAALTGNFTPSGAWAHGMPRACRRPRAGTYATGKHGYLNSLTLAVDGVAQPVVSGSAMVALCTAIAGADANGGLTLSARRAGVRVQLLGGLSKTLGITISKGSTIDVVIQQGTDGGGAVTSTGQQTVDMIERHGEASDLLRAKITGTGGGLTATTGATAVKFIELLGAADQEIDNSAGGSPLALLPSVTFQLGKFGVLPDTSAPLLDSMAFLIDDQTVSSAADPLAIQVPVVLIDERGLYYVDLEAAR